MEGFDDYDDAPHDVWSDALREDLFSGYDLVPLWDTNSNNPPLPRFPLLDPPRGNQSVTPVQPQAQGVNTQTQTLDPSMSNSQNNASDTRKRPHTDLSTLPQIVNSAATTSNSHAQPPSSPTHVPQAPVTAPPGPRPVPPSLPSDLESDSSDPTSPLTSSARSDTPWPPDDIERMDQFVDLTGDSSPPAPNPLQQALPRSPCLPRRNAISDSVSGPIPGNLAGMPFNPAKRRKTGTTISQSSQRPVKIEGIDLTAVDDDRGLSKVLEHQRLATIKAQQEQASKPVKLSTLQCIICMDNMQNITATLCGHLFCHSCLMEALIAGENQGIEPGKGIPKCPVCRKKVVRPSSNDKRRSDVVPLSIKLKARNRGGKGKGKALE